MWDVGLRGGVGVVVLSGDRHEFAATAFPPPAGSKWPLSATVNEYSTSPLSQFWLPVPTYRQTDDDIVVKCVYHNLFPQINLLTLVEDISQEEIAK
jgi:alkaline phosphatase D